MTKEELLKRLHDIKETGVKGDGFHTPEWDHQEADNTLLAYIDDIEIASAFHAVERR